MLTLSDVSWGVQKNTILHNIDLSIETWQAIGLVGPNGCGKTSLLNTINGFNKPTHGTITYDSSDVTHWSVEKRARSGIGRVFQSFGIFKNLTLFENLALAYINKLGIVSKLLPLRFLPQYIHEEIADILHTLELYDKRNERAGSLSGGQMRLLEIARLYLQDTQVYLLDEPTAGISPKLKSTVVDLLQKIISTGKTVIIVEHDFKFLGEFVDRLIVMEDGQIVLDGTYDAIKKSARLKEIYFW